MSLVERGARALAASTMGSDWDTLDAPLREKLKDDVRAVVRALRDPDARMKEAGAEIISNVRPSESEEAHLNDAANTWRFMIDAALAAGK